MTVTPKRKAATQWTSDTDRAVGLKRVLIEMNVERSDLVGGGAPCTNQEVVDGQFDDAQQDGQFDDADEDEPNLQPVLGEDTETPGAITPEQVPSDSSLQTPQDSSHAVLKPSFLCNNPDALLPHPPEWSHMNECNVLYQDISQVIPAFVPPLQNFPLVTAGSSTDSALQNVAQRTTTHVVPTALQQKSETQSPLGVATTVPNHVAVLKALQNRPKPGLSVKNPTGRPLPPIIIPPSPPLPDIEVVVEDVGEDVLQRFGVENDKVTHHDVLCGRGGGTNVYSGNVKWRNLIKQHKLEYNMAKRRDKGELAYKIVQLIRKKRGRFLKWDDDLELWFEIGDEKAKMKTGQQLREGNAKCRRELYEKILQQQSNQVSFCHNTVTPADESE